MSQCTKEVSPMMEQYKSTKSNYQDCILFYRLGDFYEMFNEDAIVASKELDLTLTGRNSGIDGRVPMCGVPFHAYETYAQKLIAKGYKVAICEQTNNIVNKVMQREVVRIITPGTVIDTEMLNETANSFLMCLYKNKNTVSYAYSDLSTGEMYVGSYVGKNFLSYINDQIVRIMPSEIICNMEIKQMGKDLPCVQSGNQFKLNQYYDWAFDYENALSIFKSQYNLSSVKGFDFNSEENIISVGVLLRYFAETQKRQLPHLKMPRLLKDDQFMYIDTNTRKNLEIEASMHDGTKYGSLLWILDKTDTSGGSRLLRSWVRQPLQNKEDILYRLDLIDYLVNSTSTRESLTQTLSKIHDIERIAGKIAYGSVTPKECISLANSLEMIPQLKEILSINQNSKLSILASQLVDTSQFVELIRNTIVAEPPAVLKDGGFINPKCNSMLEQLVNLKNNSEDIIIKIQTREREATGIKNLKIGYNRVFGYYIEVNKSNAEQVPFTYIRRQTISNNERYTTEELKQLEAEVISSGDKALILENKIFTEFKKQLGENTAILQNIATIVSTVDALNSLAKVAYENNYVKPIISAGNKIEIIGGRHPVIEKINHSDFISNDCLLNSEDQRTMILTGPNMAGKSTYMRQVALITFMAHIGSFVPAEKAEISIVDRIFTRIGASDDLAVGQSTFMVEMIEVANILNFCTNNSLIVLDEVGRGTSTFDGLSIAWSVVEYLSTKRNAKTLFATHYHELMQLEGIYNGVKNFCISIKEIGGKLVFLRKIARGSIAKSYGIEVASLAGLPQEVIFRAKELIVQLEKQSNGATSNQEMSLYDKLSTLDVENMTDAQAKVALQELKRNINN